MADLSNVPADLKAKAGAHVAELKADLHNVENAISEHRLESVDWAALLAKAKALIALIELLTGAGQQPKPTATKHRQ